MRLLPLQLHIPGSVSRYTDVCRYAKNLSQHTIPARDSGTEGRSLLLSLFSRHADSYAQKPCRGIEHVSYNLQPPPQRRGSTGRLEFLGGSRFRFILTPTPSDHAAPSTINDSSPRFPFLFPPFPISCSPFPMPFPVPSSTPFPTTPPYSHSPSPSPTLSSSQPSPSPLLHSPLKTLSLGPVPSYFSDIEIIRTSGKKGEDEDNCVKLAGKVGKQFFDLFFPTIKEHLALTAIDVSGKSATKSFAAYLLLVDAPSGATFIMISNRDGFMTDMCHWESLFKTYRHITIYIAILFKPEERIELEWRNESDLLNRGWMEYPEDPPQWLPTYWSMLSLKRLASV